MPSPHAFPGSRTRVMAGGKPIGWATGLTIDEQVNLTAVDVLDDPYTQELEVNSVSVTGTASKVYIFGNDVVEEGQYPQGSPGAERHKIVLKAPVDLQVVDGVKGVVLATAYGCKFTSRQYHISRDGVMMLNCAFRGIYMQTHAVQYGP